MEPTLARLPFVWIKASAQYQGVACAEMLPKDMCYYSSPLDQQGLRSLSLSAFCLNRWDWESEGKKAILFSLTLPIHKHKPGLLGLRKGTAPTPLPRRPDILRYKESQARDSHRHIDETANQWNYVYMCFYRYVHKKCVPMWYTTQADIMCIE